MPALPEAKRPLAAGLRRAKLEGLALPVRLAGRLASLLSYPSMQRLGLSLQGGPSPAAGRRNV